MARIVLSIAFAAALASPAAAKPKAPEDFAETSLAAGLNAGFGLQQLGGDDADAQPLDGRLVERPDAILRVLVNPASGGAFGYRLEASTVSSTLFGVMRVDIRALNAEDAKEVKRLRTCASCPAVHLLTSSPTRFPPTQVIRDGDTMLVDLLVRPDTGEKIVDVVRFSLEAVSRRTVDETRVRVVQAFRHVRLGDDLFSRGQIEAAAGMFAKAATLQPDAATHLRLGRCYEMLDRLEPAQQEYERVVGLNAGDADAWFRLGVLRHRRGQFGKAVNAYERALKLRRDWPLAQRNLATAYLDRDDLDKAFREYREAYRARRAILDAEGAAGVAARDPGLQHYVFAKVYAAEGEIESALASLKKAKDAGFHDLERIREDAEFKPFLTDPRLVALIGLGSRS
jgi:tetratricopeptide (TPR) repeat protein